MGNFNIGALGDWCAVAIGELVTFELPPGGFRRVEFDVMAEERVSCRVLTADEFWPVGVGEGLFTCRFSTSESVSLAFFGPDDAVVMLRTKVVTQVVPESLEASYTSIEPRGAGPSDEMRRLMHMQQLNAARREAILMAELRELRGRVDRDPEPVIEENKPPPASETEAAEE